MLSNTLEKLEAVLRGEGVVFIEADDECGPGIRLRHHQSDKGSKPKKRRRAPKKSK